MLEMRLYNKMWIKEATLTNNKLEIIKLVIPHISVLILTYTPYH